MTMDKHNPSWHGQGVPCHNCIGWNEITMSVEKKQMIAEHVYTTGFGGDAHGCIECGLSHNNPRANHITVQDLDSALIAVQDHITNAKANLTLAFGSDNVVERMSLLNIAKMYVDDAQKSNLHYLRLRKLLLDAGLI